MRPGTNAWLLFIQSVPTRVDLIFSSMIVISGPHVAHKAKLINLLCEVRPPIRNFDTTLAMFFETYLHGINSRVNIAHINIFRGD